MKLKNDFFWKSYCAFYKPGDDPELEVKPPSNFCHYFWCGLAGMFIRLAWWVGGLFVRCPAWLCPLLTVVAWLPIFGAEVLLDEEFLQNNHWFVLTLLPFALFGFAMLLAGPIKGLLWLYDKTLAKTSEKCQTGVFYAIMAIGGWGVLSLILNNPESAAKLGTLILWLPVFLVGVVAASLLLASTIVGVGWLCGHAASTSLIQNIGRYYKAFKQKVCPIVEPPDEFLEAKKVKEQSCTTSGSSCPSSTVS